eukprot:sb/3479090/
MVPTVTVRNERALRGESPPRGSSGRAPLNLMTVRSMATGDLPLPQDEEDLQLSTGPSLQYDQQLLGPLHQTKGKISRTKRKVTTTSTTSNCSRSQS